MKEGTQYYCGSYNDLMDTDKPKASCDLSNKDIKAVLKDIEYGLCNVDTTCEIGKEIVKTTIDDHTQYTYQDIAICSTCHFENAIICDGKCVDMMRNPNACGGCGNVCKKKESCIDGICQTKTEEKNCCGDACKQCESNEKCSNGKCIIATECDIDEYKCFCNDMEVPDGCETDITSSAEHCGKCGNLCATGAICEKGSCCYSDTDNIDVSRSQFQCCSGNNLYEYKPHFAFPFCWGSARYACSTEKMDNDSCWRAVE